MAKAKANIHTRRTAIGRKIAGGLWRIIFCGIHNTELDRAYEESMEGEEMLADGITDLIEFFSEDRAK